MYYTVDTKVSIHLAGTQQYLQDQPAHPRSLNRDLPGPTMGSQESKKSSGEQRKL